MSDPAYKNLWLSIFPALTKISATKDTVEIIKDAETAINRMLENLVYAKRTPLEVQMRIIDYPRAPLKVEVRVVAAREGDAETIKRFYETKKQKQDDAD